MANNREEAGKGMLRPGDPPGARRPYATIEGTATEVEGAGGPAASRGAAASDPGQAAQAQAAAGEPKAPPAADADRDAAAGRAGIAAALGAARARLASVPFLTHVAAGAAGALLVILAGHLFSSERPPAPPQQVGEITRRLSEVEGIVGLRPGTGLRTRVEELARSLGALGEAQARLARETKALEGKVASPELPPELSARLAKLEEVLAAPPATGGERAPQIAALAARLDQLERSGREAGEADKAALARFTAELAAARTEAGRLAQRIDGIKGEVEEQVKGTARTSELAALGARIALVEKELRGFLAAEADRTANAMQIVLALELANLKRAIDRGEPFAAELAQAKKVAAGRLDLAPLERYMLEGVPSQQELVRSFRKVANAMLDAEAEPADASLLDRLLAGARSIVRVRKAGHSADDTSLEAVVGRMETAVKEGRLAEALANAKKLPPKAALAGEDWVRKAEARHAVDRALADIEASLKAALGAGLAGSERTR